MCKKPILPPTYLLISIFLMLILFFIFPGVMLIPSPWNFLGLIPLGFGLWINMIADRAFRKAKTTVKPFEEPAALITDGAFAICRHPMYLGFVAILIGVALLFRALTPFLIVIIFAVLMDQLFIRVEEGNLESKFGQSWLEYKKKVRRWI